MWTQFPNSHPGYFSRWFCNLVKELKSEIGVHVCQRKDSAWKHLCVRVWVFTWHTARMSTACVQTRAAMFTTQQPSPCCIIQCRRHFFFLQLRYADASPSLVLTLICENLCEDYPFISPLRRDFARSSFYDIVVQRGTEWSVNRRQDIGPCPSVHWCHRQKFLTGRNRKKKK